MNLFWLFLILPGYAVSAGFAGHFFHNLYHGGKDCDDVLCGYMGLIWPAVTAVIVVYLFVWAGIQLEMRLVPSSRKLARDRKIAQHEKTLQILDGKVVPYDGD